MQPTSNEQPGPLVALAQTLEQFPAFLAGWLIQTFISIISDPLVFCVTLGSVAFGLIFGLLPGLAMFFLLYPTLRMVATVAQGLGMAGNSVSQAIVHHANVQLQQPQPVAPELPDGVYPN